MGADDEPVLAAVLEQVKDGDAFFKRVRELYADPNADDLCEIELKDGRTLDRRSTVLRRGDGQILGRVWFFADITERKKVEYALLTSELRFRRLVESNLIGVFISHQDGLVTEANERALEMLGYDRDDLNNGRIHRDRLTPPEQVSASALLVEELIRREVTTPWETEYFRKHGSRIPILIGVASLQNAAGDVIGILVDLTKRRLIEEEMRRATAELQRANEKLMQLSSVDGLTGVANRRAFDQALDREWARMMRTDEPFSLLLLDVDHFKILNDTEGHQRGDECLVRIAGELRRLVKRETDLVARYGGEEFVIILAATSEANAMRFAEGMRTAIAGLGLNNPGSPVVPTVTVSIGVATAARAAFAGVTDLVAAADSAMYAAKHLGRNRVTCSGQTGSQPADPLLLSARRKTPPPAV